MDHLYDLVQWGEIWMATHTGNFMAHDCTKKKPKNERKKKMVVMKLHQRRVGSVKGRKCVQVVGGRKEHRARGPHLLAKKDGLFRRIAHPLVSREGGVSVTIRRLLRQWRRGRRAAMVGRPRILGVAVKAEKRRSGKKWKETSHKKWLKMMKTMGEFSHT